ncbi:uncharacterized protein EI90DRAFT_3041442 [Cantharellus anzutake]|uniref:uncharacterized protein n=1 Tax=Cantharellus anzutake TaxID=1750568 RepID=UPI001907378C|nr:uncharacterized protein EI90DRAFT_3041442 [Cantharellus anzutake]KAF8338055.1 hypothetical protein EI90DRAFT_3041442 [Cantharellus anzutake]
MKTRMEQGTHPQGKAGFGATNSTELVSLVLDLRTPWTPLPLLFSHWPPLPTLSRFLHQPKVPPLQRSVAPQRTKPELGATKLRQPHHYRTEPQLRPTKRFKSHSRKSFSRSTASHRPRVHRTVLQTLPILECPKQEHHRNLLPDDEGKLILADLLVDEKGIERVAGFLSASGAYEKERRTE